MQCISVQHFQYIRLFYVGTTGPSSSKSLFNRRLFSIMSLDSLAPVPVQLRNLPGKIRASLTISQGACQLRFGFTVFDNRVNITQNFQNCNTCYSEVPEYLACSLDASYNAFRNIEEHGCRWMAIWWKNKLWNMTLHLHTKRQKKLIIIHQNMELKWPGFYQ